MPAAGRGGAEAVRRARTIPAMKTRPLSERGAFFAAEHRR
jgi:hypothetical protein